MKESNIQQRIRLAASENDCTLFRTNVGKGWTGNEIIRHKNGDVTVKNARPFSSGLPKGFPDLAGWKTKTITADMVGKEIALFVGVEVKTDKGAVRPDQVNFINNAKGKGAICDVCRSVSDFESLVK